MERWSRDIILGRGFNSQPEDFELRFSQLVPGWVLKCISFWHSKGHFLTRLKNEPSRKFIDVKCLKIDLVWAVKSSKKYIESSKRALSHIKKLIKHVFILF